MKINKSYTITSWLIMAWMLMSACTEIMDIDIQGSTPEMVVEANIGRGEIAIVKLSQTVNLYTAEAYPPIVDAIVTLTDNNGVSETLTQVAPGVYVSTHMQGEVGMTYHLLITVKEKTITAACRMPNYVPVDSFRVVNSIYPGGGPPLLPDQPADFYEVLVTYTDPANEKNYYRLMLFVNGIPAQNNYVYDDRLTSGKQVDQLLVIYNPEIKTGDSIFVEMQCIDKAIFEYYKSISNSSMGPGNGSSPANPYTNLKGATLGCFSAHTVERWQYCVE